MSVAGSITAWSSPWVAIATRPPVIPPTLLVPLRVIRYSSWYGTSKRWKMVGMCKSNSIPIPERRRSKKVV